MVLRFALLVVLLIGGLFATAQEKFKTISGKVLDLKTGQPVPFASIHLKSGSSGTATNNTGEFIFKFSDSALQDTLVVSSIGYITIQKPLSTLGLNVAFSLQPAAIELAEVTVQAQTGLDIIKKVITRIPENYDTAGVRLTAFYRENLWIGDFELNYTEAVLDIYKIFRVDKVLNDQIRIVKGRKKDMDFSKDPQFYYWINGISNGVRGSLGDDLVKYHNIKQSPFNPANYKYYDYDYVETIREDHRNLIVVHILPKKNSRKAILKLKVYIDEESLAIARYDWITTEAGVRRVSRKDKGIAYAIMSKVVKATIDYHSFQGVVNFKEYNNKWYMDRVTRHWEILVSSRKRNMVNAPWVADMDLKITDVRTKDVTPITEGDIGGNKNSFHSFIRNDNDEAFWENYNILKPVAIDSLTRSQTVPAFNDSVTTVKKFYPNRQNGFTRADTLRGKLTPLRTCYDVTFYHLDVAVDLQQRSVKGNNLIRFTAQQPFKKMQIDLYNNMKIDKIIYKGSPLAYTREYNAVFINFPAGIKKGTSTEIKIYYEGVPQVPDKSIPMHGGILWDKDSLGNTWAQMVCQGSGASLWWPNKDHQSDEPDSMKIWITVPSEFVEISNGRLQRKTPMPNNQTRYEWYVSYPINNYNVTFGIGKYTHFRDFYITNDTLTIDYYVMPYHFTSALKLSKQVIPMLKTFEKNFGKYPFPRDGFTIVESLYPMEHQSGVCIGKITPETSGESNPLLWHESAHEWWGNAITTKDIADMWIHEAFATYAEAQVVEDLLGKEATQTYIAEQAEAVSGTEPVIGIYDVNHIHYDIGDMYSKGSMMLHTFRNVLDNDSLWADLLRAIQDHFRYKTLSSDELVAFINKQTHTDYTYFFDQYLKYTDLPELEIVQEQKGEDLQIRYRWVANVKNFRMPVKVTTLPETFTFIYPTTEWKTMLLKKMTVHDFEVDEESFFIDVELE